mmetsp:Transcript_9005/g.18753  ORF Transcript_9005/g.18753 Transcript_9005/m.18753 type:complete len:166 (+) Transcript_9005:690-1187(+)
MQVQTQPHESLRHHPRVDGGGDEIPPPFQETADGVEESPGPRPRGHHVMNGELYADHVEFVGFGNASSFSETEDGIPIEIFGTFVVPVPSEESLHSFGAGRSFPPRDVVAQIGQGEGAPPERRGRFFVGRAEESSSPKGGVDERSARHVDSHVIFHSSGMECPFA